MSEEQQFPWKESPFAPADRETAERWIEALEASGPEVVRGRIAQNASFGPAAAIPIGAIQHMTLGFAEHWLAWTGHLSSITETAVLKRRYVLTTALAVIALLVSVSSALFSWWQFSLNLERDRREMNDRSPVVALKAEREASSQRRFHLHVIIKNGPYSQAELRSFELLEPANFEIAVLPRENLKGSLDSFGVPHKVTFNANTIDPGEQITWDVNIDVPDQVAIPRNAMLKIRVNLRLTDNRDTELSIDKMLALPGT